MSVAACATLLSGTDDVVLLAHCFESIDRSLGQAVPREEFEALLSKVEEAKSPANLLGTVQHDDRQFLEAWFMGEDKDNLKKLVTGNPSAFKRYLRNELGWRGARLAQAQAFITQLVQG